MKAQLRAELNRERRLVRAGAILIQSIMTAVFSEPPAVAATITTDRTENLLAYAQQQARSGGLQPFTCSDQRECSLLALLEQWAEENQPARTGQSRIVYSPICDDYECTACVGYQPESIAIGICAVVGCLTLDAATLGVLDETIVSPTCIGETAHSPTSRRAIERIDDLLPAPPEAVRLLERARSLSGQVTVVISRAGAVISTPAAPGFGTFDRKSDALDAWFLATYSSGLHFKAQPGSEPSVLTLSLELLSVEHGIAAVIEEQSGCYERRWRAESPNHLLWKSSEWRKSGRCESQIPARRP